MGVFSTIPSFDTFSPVFDRFEGSIGFMKSARVFLHRAFVKITEPRRLLAILCRINKIVPKNSPSFGANKKSA